MVLLHQEHVRNLEDVLPLTHGAAAVAVLIDQGKLHLISLLISESLANFEM